MEAHWFFLIILIQTFSFCQPDISEEVHVGCVNFCMHPISCSSSEMSLAWIVKDDGMSSSLKIVSCEQGLEQKNRYSRSQLCCGSFRTESPSVPILLYTTSQVTIIAHLA